MDLETILLLLTPTYVKNKYQPKTNYEKKIDKSSWVISISLIIIFISSLNYSKDIFYNLFAIILFSSAIILFRLAINLAIHISIISFKLILKIKRKIPSTRISSLISWVFSCFLFSIPLIKSIISSQHNFSLIDIIPYTLSFIIILIFKLFIIEPFVICIIFIISKFKSCLKNIIKKN